MAKNKIIAGVDEVGRGSWIGPVFSAAVILNKKINNNILKDSKKISYENRLKLSNYIKANSYFAIARASVKEIEKKNILQATLLSMKRAIKKLNKNPDLILVDGNHVPKINNIKIKAIIRGDEIIPSISAASIIAKVARDKHIKKLSEKFTKYSWDTNFGYGTKKHQDALKKFGVTSHHRKTYKPIHKILSQK